MNLIFFNTGQQVLKIRPRMLLTASLSGLFLSAGFAVSGTRSSLKIFETFMQ